MHMQNVKNVDTTLLSVRSGAANLNKVISGNSVWRLARAGQPRPAARQDRPTCHYERDTASFCVRTHR